MKLTKAAPALTLANYSRSRLERLRVIAVSSFACAASVGFLSVDLLASGSYSVASPFCQPAFAAQNSDERLAKLEVKFFKHTFPKDDDTVRLERLEKMIFGEAKSGNNSERLKNLADTVPNLASIKVADDGTEATSDGDSGASSSGTNADSSPAVGSGSSSRYGSSNSSASGSSSRSGAGAASKRRSAADDYDDTASGSSTGSARPGGQVLQGESKYPAVTALEMSIFKRDYASDPVGDRLNRLESKVFGKPSRFTDLSERVDALKDKLNVDLAKSRPAGSDWIDDEDDDMTQQASSPRRNSEPVARSDGDDGRSFSGRDLRKDMQRAFGNSAGGSYGGSGYGGSTGGASGSYGAGSYGAGAGAGLVGSGNSASGAYGMGSGASGRSSRRASSASQGQGDDIDMGDASGAGVLGLSSQVSALENAVLGKTYKDPLISRVARLEDTVFQGKAEANASLSLPERVAKLTQKVPIAKAPPRTASSRRSRSDDDFGDDDDMGMSMGSGMGGMSSGMAGGGMSQTTQSRSGGLSKIINSIGNMLGGGSVYAGSYGMGGGMVRDPSTGFLVDTTTGNLINPSTGMVVGRSAGYPVGGYGMSGINGIGGISGIGGINGMGLGGIGTVNPLNTPLGYNGLPYNGGGFGYAPTYPSTVNPLGGFNSFNNGFSPYGYGYPGMVRPGVNFGTGGFGIRF